MEHAGHFKSPIEQCSFIQKNYDCGGELVNNCDYQQLIDILMAFFSNCIYIANTSTVMLLFINSECLISLSSHTIDLRYECL